MGSSKDRSLDRLEKTITNLRNRIKTFKKEHPELYNDENSKISKTKYK